MRILDSKGGECKIRRKRERKNGPKKMERGNINIYYFYLEKTHHNGWVGEGVGNLLFITGNLNTERMEKREEVMVKVTEKREIKSCMYLMLSVFRSSAMEAYYNKDKMHSQNFHSQLKVLQDTVPTIREDSSFNSPILKLILNKLQGWELRNI